MAESGSLENCCPGNGTVGSIPTLSAKSSLSCPPALESRPVDTPPPCKANESGSHSPFICAFSFNARLSSTIARVSRLQ